MPRIRTIKPEFWTDDLIGSLSMRARLLFIASWNLADDEGLLRWSSAFIKGAVFPFDDSISVADVAEDMASLASAGIIFPYVGGRSQQALAYVVNFHKHQKVNRPSPSKLPPPPVTDPKVKAMYASRDGGICHLCGGPFDDQWTQVFEDAFFASPDHVKPLAAGGSDYPSNILSAHITCNKGRRDRSIDQYKACVSKGETVAQKRFPERFKHLAVSHSVSDAGSDSVPETETEREMETEHGKGNGNVGGKGNGKGFSGTDDAIGAFVLVWNSTDGATSIRKLTDKRRAALTARLAEPDWDWRAALAKFPLRCFASDPDGYVPDIEFFLRPDTVTRILEGKYDWSKSNVRGGSPDDPRGNIATLNRYLQEAKNGDDDQTIE